jgi:hypothetical protein
MLFSSADRRAYVYRDGIEIGRAQIGGVDATTIPSQRLLRKWLRNPCSLRDIDQIRRSDPGLKTP